MSTPAPVAETEAYDNCLLAMARAVENAGMYGAAHPAVQDTVDRWFRLLAPLIRSRGKLTLDSDGHSALMNGVPLSGASGNPVILSLLRKLYTTRAGRLELLSGFSAKSAGLMAEYLAGADATRLADEEHSLKMWIAQRQIRHVRVSPLRLLEAKDGDRIVSAERKRPAARSLPPAERLRPEAIATWASEFKADADRSGPSRVMPRKALNVLVAFLRGTTDAAPASMVEHIARAAENAAYLSELILKSALVQHELSQRFDEPVGDDVMACLRAVINALQEAPAAQTEEGWRDVARTLTALETCILDRLQALAGGTEKDAEVIRSGVRALHHDIEGAALKREYDQKRTALLAVERRIRKFFGLDPRDATDTPLMPPAGRR